MYLRSIPRDKVSAVLDTLFQYYSDNKLAGETLGYFNRRVGNDAIV